METGNRDYASHVVGNGKVVFSFVSALNPSGHDAFGAHLQKHGDGVKDVAFHVDDAKALFEKAVSRGAQIVDHPKKIEDKETGGFVILASVQTYGDTTHTFVERSPYFKGAFLPGYIEHPKAKVSVPRNMLSILQKPNLLFIDHCVGN